MRLHEIISEAPPTGTMPTTGTVNKAVNTGPAGLGGRGSTISKIKNADGTTTTTDQVTGDTVHSGGMGATTTNRAGDKTQHQTPRIHGLQVTKKYDPNELNLDPDQTSDDPTSTSTNYRGKFKDPDGVTDIDITQQGGPEQFDVNKPASDVKIRRGSAYDSNVTLRSRDPETGKPSAKYRAGPNKFNLTPNR
jgi:hypothetical protein